MAGFLDYYISRSLNEILDLDVISESTDFSVSSFVRRNKSRGAMSSHIAKLSKKHPSIQHCDIEDCILDALSDVRKAKPPDKESAESIFKKKLKSHLSKASGRKKGVKKNLSCVKSIKVSGEELNSLLRRADRILTSNEKKVLELCSKGESVRSIGPSMGMSFATAWRTLNSAIDKIRISHGMKSRHMDRR